VIIGSDEVGRKELLALSDSYRESEASWREVLMDLKQRDLECAPRLAVGDGVLGLWKAVANKCWPQTNQQRYWVHKIANVTVRLKTAKTKNCDSRTTMLTMAFKLMETAQKNGYG